MHFLHRPPPHGENMLAFERPRPTSHGGGGINTIMEELNTLLNVWPRGSDYPHGVILLHSTPWPAPPRAFGR